MLYVTRKYGRPNRKERNKTKKRKTITWTCIVCWNGYSTMQRTTFIDWKTIVLSSYWHSWLTISIVEGGFYNGGISFNHLQLLAGWIHGCFRTRFNKTSGPHCLIHWVTIPSFLWSPRQRKMDSRAIVCEVTKSDCSGNRDSAAC